MFCVLNVDYLVNLYNNLFSFLDSIKLFLVCGTEYLRLCFSQISRRREGWRRLEKVSFTGVTGETAAEGKRQAESKFDRTETKLSWRTDKTGWRQKEKEIWEEWQSRACTPQKEQIRRSSLSCLGLWWPWGSCQREKDRNRCKREKEEEEDDSVRFVRMKSACIKN